MNEQIKIMVYRTFDPEEGLPTSPRALALHRERSACLHEMLDKNSYWKVADWGKTDDDNRAHEVIDAVLDLLSNPEVIEGAKYLGGLLLTSGVSVGVTEGVKWIVSKVRPHQKANRITNVYINVTPDTTVHINPFDDNIVFTQTIRDSGDLSK